MEGASFSQTYRGLALLMVLGGAFWFATLLWRGHMASAVGPRALLWSFAAAWAVMAWMLWYALTGRTRINSTHISQDWVWAKQVDLQTLAYAKLMRVRGWEWLIAPRLYTRSLSGKLAILHVADQAVLAECERLVTELRAHRGF